MTQSARYSGLTFKVTTWSSCSENSPPILMQKLIGQRWAGENFKCIWISLKALLWFDIHMGLRLMNSWTEVHLITCTLLVSLQNRQKIKKIGKLFICELQNSSRFSPYLLPFFVDYQLMCIWLVSHDSKWRALIFCTTVINVPRKAWIMLKGICGGKMTQSQQKCFLQ